MDACYADLVYVDKKDTGRIVRYWKSNDYRHGLCRKGWMPAHPTFYVRRRVFEQYGGFDLQYRLLNLRVNVPKPGAQLPSLGPSFANSFTYENEFQDLFGIKVTGLNPDFEGKFYKKSAPTPFAAPGNFKKEGA